MKSTAPPDLRNESCPYFRLIWDVGYTHFHEDHIKHEYVLFSERLGERRINKHDFDQMAVTLTVKRGVMKDDNGVTIGEPHSWISDGDGSADRFREFLNPDITRIFSK
jgi:hypothetical protein